ncbi:type II toxin-antitoxin system RelB/DinJ family antitoxin [Tritonibacter multivorans]|uniref:type II toxin-antitoxin system RelB/DinJ family antitoxin n=1 Tax=Tritonibacter multivorans TaxID=928856 RepID=UPI0008F0AA3D|nr:type II toxin-antitoxin system RelB/DinJ family antitoxin [Tritonibacter multivorans]MDA7423052.1 type II toxin-antitoxin system RelB/DinJ family antitoxin [Tritonibacter multivorans]SFD81315.1 DNA-damage-inducible protein J [Tritonibacter multivorans]
MPTADQVVRARVDEDVKKQATEIFEQMGITMSGAIRMLLAQVVAEKALPFEVRAPNAVTQEALAASRAGEVSSFASVDDLFSDLEDDED